MGEYDYIIIGAGSAGCVLAKRLADADHSVLLLEAGKDPVTLNKWNEGGKLKNKLLGQRIEIPGAYGTLHTTNVDWQFWSEKQSIIGKEIYLPRGKTLGGSSATNAMVYVRGNQADFDEWNAMVGGGWGYKDVLDYFKKSEHYQCAKISDKYRGKKGEMYISKPAPPYPFSEAFIKACDQNSIRETDDYNGKEQKGASIFQQTIKDGVRQSTYEAFLKPKPNNLTIITNATVEKIDLEKVGKDKCEAKGVRYFVDNKRPIEVLADKEVIICAGAFQSPQLLMLSGIGDTQELDDARVHLVHHLPVVGKNLQDHLFYLLSSSSTQEKGFNHLLKGLKSDKDLFKYFRKVSQTLKTSPLEAVAFLAVNHEDVVNLQYHFTPLHLGPKYDADLYNIRTYPKSPDGYSIAPTLLKPKSRGSITLKKCFKDKRKCDPKNGRCTLRDKECNLTKRISIQPEFLTENEDINTLITGGIRALRILQSDAFNDYRQEIFYPPGISKNVKIPEDFNLPKGFNIHEPFDESKPGYELIKPLWEHIKKQVETVYHPVGTCRMGMSKQDSVVDNQLRVHGVDKLRVVDASVMPTIVRGNTNAAVIMIAEKAADMILKGTT